MAKGGGGRRESKGHGTVSCFLTTRILSLQDVYISMFSLVQLYCI